MVNEGRALFESLLIQHEDKIEAAIIGFEGDALLWYQWEHKKRPMVHWEEMELLILKKFRSSRAKSLHEQFLAIHQEDSIGDYNRKFIELLAPLDNVSDEVALSTFIKGLKPKMRTELRVFEPTTLNRAMDLANRINEKL